MGTSFATRPPRVLLSWELSVCTSSAPVVTSTMEVMSPTSILALASVTWLEFTWTFLTTYFLKPSFSTVMEYDPTSRLGST